MPAKLVEHFEWQAQRGHLLMALPAECLACDVHPFAERQGVIGWQLSINGDWRVGDRSAKQPFLNPLTAIDGVVLEVGRVRNQPARLRENARPLSLVQRERHVLGPLFGRDVVVLVDAVAFVIKRCDLACPTRLTCSLLQLNQPVPATASFRNERTVGRQQLAEHVCVLIDEMQHEQVGIGDKRFGAVVSTKAGFSFRCQIFEDLRGLCVSEILLEEPQHGRSEPSSDTALTVTGLHLRLLNIDQPDHVVSDCVDRFQRSITSRIQ